MSEVKKRSQKCEEEDEKNIRQRTNALLNTIEYRKKHSIQQQECSKVKIKGFRKQQSIQCFKNSRSRSLLDYNIKDSNQSTKKVKTSPTEESLLSKKPLFKNIHKSAFQAKKSEFSTLTIYFDLEGRSLA